MSFMSALGSVFGGGGGAEKQGGRGTPMMSPIGSGLQAKDKRERERRQHEYENQARNESIFNFERADRAYERGQDLAGQLGGQLQTDYITADALVPESVDDIGGGALRNLLLASSGYNPTMAYNPYLDVLQGDRQMVEGLRAQANEQADDTIAGYEREMGELAGAYDYGADRLASERDEARDTYEAAIEADREEATEQEAQHIVEQWIASEDAGYLPNELKDRRGRESKNEKGRGKVLGAKNDSKEDMVDEMLRSGYSYAQILTSGNLSSMISQDDNTSGLYEAWARDNDLERKGDRWDTPSGTVDGNTGWDSWGGFY